jgi:hypothetical protein
VFTGSYWQPLELSVLLKLVEELEAPLDLKSGTGKLAMLTGLRPQLIEPA